MPVQCLPDLFSEQKRIAPEAVIKTLLARAGACACAFPAFPATMTSFFFCSKLTVP